MDVEKTIREYIEPLVHMSLASTVDDRPWVCEVHFAADDQLNLYFRSLASRRHSQEIARNPRVAGNIVRQYELGEPGVGVYFEGEARRLTDDPELDQAFEALERKLGVSADGRQEATRPDGHQVYKINVENWYLFGRFDGPSGQKYKLEWNASARASGPTHSTGV